MLRIRPHHILCIRAYKGSGYSEEFTKRMEEIIKEIKAYNIFLNSYNEGEEKKEIKIVYSTDSICESCPNKLDENKCSSQEKVNLLDLKVSKYFNIKEGIYNYNDIENLVYNSINEKIFNEICKTCEWYNVTKCREYIL